MQAGFSGFSSLNVYQAVIAMDPFYEFLHPLKFPIKKIVFRLLNIIRMETLRSHHELNIRRSDIDGM